MALHECYHDSTLIQRMIAVGGCVIGGGIVLVLGLIGAFGESEALVRMGYGIHTIPCYAIVIACGFLILARVKFAAFIATAAAALEIVFYICVQLSTTPEVGFLILLKIAVIVCLLQLVTRIYSFEEAENDMPQALPRRTGPQPPQGRQRAAVPPRNRQVVNRNQPPRPRR